MVILEEYSMCSTEFIKWEGLNLTKLLLIMKGLLFWCGEEKKALLESSMKWLSSDESSAFNSNIFENFLRFPFLFSIL